MCIRDRNTDLAIQRQHAVLKSMLRHGYIDNATYILALEEPINLRDSVNKRELKADYVAEMVRQELYKEFGDGIYTSGLKVFTTIKKKNQLYANRSVQNNFINYMIRNGLNPPESFINLEDKNYSTIKERDKNILQQLRLIPTYGEFIPGIILNAQPLKITALLKNGEKINIYKRGLKLLQRDFKIEEKGERLIKPGVIMRFVKNRGVWHVTQLPKVESSLVSLSLIHI